MIGDIQELLVDGKPFTMFAGEVHNSTGSCLRAMEHAWEVAERLHLNSLLVPVSWELTEPAEGVFDFSLVDGLIAQARERGMRLGLLWFGSWKNASCSYAPAWVKRDIVRFPRAEVVMGEHKLTLTNFHDMSYTTLSMFGEQTRAADARAFAAFMGHLREVDGGERTVVAVQVENECGLMGAAREHSEAADHAFAQSVPNDLLDALRACDTLAPDIAAALESGSEAGSWAEVFGPVSEEIFTAYHVATYVEDVASAGRAVYDLPLVVNCWLDKGHRPGRFPTGGPVARVLEIWRHVARSVDVVAPDIYVPTFCETCDSYRKLDNPLFIAETAYHAYAAPRAIWAIGAHRALCYAPFGIEDLGEPFDAAAGVLFGADPTDPALGIPQDVDEYAEVIGRLRALLDIVQRGETKHEMQAVISERPEQHEMVFDDVAIDVDYEGFDLPGACLAMRTAEGVFWIVALRSAMRVVSRDGSRPNIDVISLDEEILLEDGSLARGRRLNGDEIMSLSFDAPVLLRMEVFSYQ